MTHKQTPREARRGARLCHTCSSRAKPPCSSFGHASRRKRCTEHECRLHCVPKNQPEKCHEQLYIASSVSGACRDRRACSLHVPGRLQRFGRVESEGADGQLRGSRSVEARRRTNALQAHQSGGATRLRTGRQLHVRDACQRVPSVLREGHRGCSRSDRSSPARRGRGSRRGRSLRARGRSCSTRSAERRSRRGRRGTRPRPADRDRRQREPPRVPPGSRGCRRGRRRARVRGRGSPADSESPRSSGTSTTSPAGPRSAPRRSAATR